MATTFLTTSFENQGQFYDPGVKSKRRQCIWSISLQILHGLEERYRHYVGPRGMKRKNAAMSHIQIPRLQVNEGPSSLGQP